MLAVAVGTAVPGAGEEEEGSSEAGANGPAAAEGDADGLRCAVPAFGVRLPAPAEKPTAVLAVPAVLGVPSQTSLTLMRGVVAMSIVPVPTAPPRLSRCWPMEGAAEDVGASGALSPTDRERLAAAPLEPLPR